VVDSDQSEAMMRWLFTLVILTLCFSAPVRGQDDEMALIDRVAFLQHQLQSDKTAERDAAEKELLDLGPKVLDHLEPVDNRTPTDIVQRLQRIRKELETVAVREVTQASKVTLQGKMKLGDALGGIREQTGNDVAMPGETPDVLVNREIELDLEDVDFWVAVAKVMSEGQLEVDPYAGKPGQLRLTPTQAARIAAANPGLPDPKPKPVAPPRNASGIFDLMVTKVNASRNLLNPELNYCNVTVRVRWEPRVQPVSIDLPVSSISAIDEFDNSIAIPNPDGVISGLVQPEIPELEFSIPIGLVDRQIEVINSLDATIDAVLPGRTEIFRFKKLGNLDPGYSQQKAGATVTFEGIIKNDDLFGVKVRLSFEEDNNALESHRGWAFNNPMHLVDENEEKLEPIALETISQDNAEVVIRYYFERDPEDLTMIYNSPAAIVKVPVKISLKNIPLP
jgi:hypothetical protein